MARIFFAVAFSIVLFFEKDKIPSMDSQQRPAKSGIERVTK
jgi:hypothetical protein